MYECKAEDGVFTMTFEAPRQLLLHEEFEQMVWDETLRQAHAAGHIPVGPIHVEHAEITDEPTALIEGESLTQRMERWAAKNMHRHVMAGMTGGADMIRVTAQVQVGLSLT